MDSTFSVYDLPLERAQIETGLFMHGLLNRYILLVKTIT